MTWRQYAAAAVAAGVIVGLVCGATAYVALRVPPAPPRLTWSATGFAVQVGACHDEYAYLDDAVRRSFCDCFMPELMRASPAPTGNITHAEVEQALKVCIHLVPDHRPAAEDSGSADDTRRSL